MPNLVHVTRPSLWILDKVQTGVFPIFGPLVNPLQTKICTKDNFRSSHDIDMKLGSVTELDKRNTATSQSFDDDVKSVNCDVIDIFNVCFIIDFPLKVCILRAFFQSSFKVFLVFHSPSQSFW